MKRIKMISSAAMMVGIMMISLGLFIQSNLKDNSLNNIQIEEFDVKDMAASANQIIKNKDTNDSSIEYSLTEVKMETAPASVIIPPRVEVYEGMTVEELSAKLDRSLGGILAGHGNVIASHSVEIGVDPYVVAAIMIHETGNGTSRIANECFNFGGQKGSGCGAWKRYSSVDEGLIGMMDNLQRNYYAYGLTTVEAIGAKYAESSSWPATIHSFINQIRAR